MEPPAGLAGHCVRGPRGSAPRQLAHAASRELNPSRRAESWLPVVHELCLGVEHPFSVEGATEMRVRGVDDAHTLTLGRCADTSPPHTPIRSGAEYTTKRSPRRNPTVHRPA